MLSFIQENSSIILIFIVCVFLYRFFLSRYVNRFFYELDQRRWTESFRGLSFITLFILCCVFQMNYHFISVEENAYTLIIGIFTIYGIFMAFFQFAVGFAIQNEHDKVWGISVTKQIVQKKLPISIFKSTLFKLILIYIVVHPMVFHFFTTTLAINTTLENGLHALWESSIFTVLLFYIILFVRSMSSIDIFFNIQENDHQIIIFDIKAKETNKFKRLFVRSITNQNEHYFIQAFLTKLHLLDDEEKKQMFIGVCHAMISELEKMQQKSERKRQNHQQKKRSIRTLYSSIVSNLKLAKQLLSTTKKKDDLTLHQVANLYSLLFHVLESEKIVLSIEELIVICRRFHNMIHTFASNDDQDMEHVVTNWHRYNQRNIHYIPRVVWESVRSIRDLDYIHHYLTTLNIPLQKEVSGFDSCLRRSFRELLEHYRMYQSELTRSHFVFGSTNRMIKTQRTEPWIQEQIFYYIFTLEYNSENAHFLKYLTNALDFKYSAAVIFNMVLYPAESKWKNEILLFRNIIRHHLSAEFDEDTIHFVAQSVKKTSIDHRIKETLIRTIIQHIKEVTFIDPPFLQVCSNEPYYSLATFVNFKYIFQDMNFTIEFSDKLRHFHLQYDKNGKWKVHFLTALLDTPGLAKKNKISFMVINNFCTFILGNDYPKSAFLSRDFRIFHVNPVFHFRIEQYQQLMDGKIPSEKGLISYLFLNITHSKYQYILSDSKKISFLIEQIDLLLNRENKTLHYFVKELAEQAKDCGNSVSVNMQEVLIDLVNSYRKQYITL